MAQSNNNGARSGAKSLQQEFTENFYDWRKRYKTEPGGLVPGDNINPFGDKWNEAQLRNGDGNRLTTTTNEIDRLSQMMNEYREYSYQLPQEQRMNMARSVTNDQGMVTDPMGGIYGQKIVTPELWDFYTKEYERSF